MGNESIAEYQKTKRAKFTALLTLLLFLFSTFITPSNLLAQAPLHSLIPAAITIPHSIANIHHTYTADSTKAPLVIHVQDAHLNYEAQKNISNILSSLQKEYAIDTVFIEGTEGELNTSLLSAFPFADKKKELVTSLVEKGKLSGAEEFSILADTSVELFGVDTHETYFSNIEAYINATRVRDTAGMYLETIQKSLDFLRPEILSSELRTFLDKKKLFLADGHDPLEYTRYLMTRCNQSGIDLSRYVHFAKLAKLDVFQDKIEPEKIMQETRALVDQSLIHVLPESDMDRLAIAEIDFHGGRLEAFKYYGLLREFAISVDIDFRAYENLNRYYYYLSLVNDINPHKLMKEREKIEAKLLKSLVQKANEKEYLLRLKHFDIIQNMFTLKAIPEDLSYFRRHKKEFSNDFFNSFFRMYNQPSIVENDFSLTESLAVFEKFYKLAESREDAFIEKTLQEMKKRDLSTSVLLTGGYHTAGLEARLQKRNVSYLVVAPRLTELPQGDLYDKVMRSYDKYFGVKEGLRGGTVKELTSFNPHINKGEYQSLLREIIPALVSDIESLAQAVDSGALNIATVEAQLDGKGQDIFRKIMALNQKDFAESNESVGDLVKDTIIKVWNARVKGSSAVFDRNEDKVMIITDSEATELLKNARSVGAAAIGSLDNVPDAERTEFDHAYQKLADAIENAFPGSFIRPMTALKYKDTAIKGDDLNREGALDIVSGNVVEINRGMATHANKLLFSWGTIPIVIPSDQIPADILAAINGATVPKDVKKKLIPVITEKLKDQGIHISDAQVRSDSLPILTHDDVLISCDIASLIPVVDKEGNLQMHIAFWFRDGNESYEALERMNKRIADTYLTYDASPAAVKWYEELSASDTKTALKILTDNNWKFYADFRRGELASIDTLIALMNQIDPADILNPAEFGIYYDDVLGQAASLKDDGSDTGVINYGKNREAFLARLDSIGILFHRLNNLVMPGYDSVKERGIPVSNPKAHQALISLYYRMNTYINTQASEYFHDIRTMEPVRIKISKFASKLNDALRLPGAIELNSPVAKDTLLNFLESKGVALTPIEVARIDAMYEEYADENYLWAYDVMQFSELVSEENFVKAFPHIKVFQYTRKLTPRDREYEVVDGSGRIATVGMVIRFLDDMNARQKDYVSRFAIRTRSIKSKNKSDFAVNEVKQMFMDDVVRNANLKLLGEDLSRLLETGLISFEAGKKISAKLDFVITDEIPSVYPVHIILRGELMGTVYLIDSQEFETGLRSKRNNLPNVPRPMIVVDENGNDLYFGTSTDATPGSVHMGDQKAVAERNELKAKGQKPKLTQPTLWEMYDVDEISEENSFAGVGDLAIEYKRLREILSRVDTERLADSGKAMTIDPAQISKLLLLRGFHAVGENIDKVLRVKETGVQFLTPTSCSTNGASYFLQGLVVLAGHILSMSGPTGHMYTGGDKAGVPGHLYPKDTGAASGVGMNIFDADVETLEAIANYLFGAVRTPTPVRDGQHVIVGGSLYTKLLLRMPIAIPQEVIVSYLDRIAQEFPTMLRMFDEDDKVDGKYLWEKCISGQQTGSILFADLITKILPTMLEMFVGYDNEGSFSFKDTEVKRTLDLARKRQKDMKRRFAARERAQAQLQAAQKKPIKRIGVLTGGGPASGHNNLIASIYEKAKAMGNDIEIVAISRGWDGLINPDSVQEAHFLTEKEALSKRYKGGTVIRTSRTNAFNIGVIEKYAADLIDTLSREQKISIDAYKSYLKAKKDRELTKDEKDLIQEVEATIVRPLGSKMLMRNIEALNLDALITAGGDDTSGAAAKLQAQYKDFPIIAVPKTMDNDIPLPDGVATYGFDSFVKEGIRQSKNLIESQSSLNRILIVETFGRKAGYVQLEIGKGIGAARTIVPEEGTVDLQELIVDLERYYYTHGEQAIVVVSEGIKIKMDETNAYLFEQAFEASAPVREMYRRGETEVDSFGHPKLKDAGRILARILATAFKERGSNITVSLAGKVDYAAREGDTSAKDLAMTKKLGEAAVQKLLDGVNGAILYVAPSGEVKEMALDSDISKTRSAKIKNENDPDRELYQASNAALFPYYKARKVEPAIDVLAQNVTVKQGAQTGEVFIDDAIEDGAHGIIVGHSEVRMNFVNANETVFNAQIKAAIAKDVKTIIYCVGESLNEKKEGISERVVEAQVRMALKDVPAGAIAEKLIIAYEPRWAIAGSGLGEAADENTAQTFAKFIRDILADMYGDDIAKQVPIQYGGSAHAGNAKAYLSQPDVDGLLVGGKSTSVKDFLPIIKIAEEVGPTNGRVPYIGANWKTYPIKSDYYEFMDAFMRIDHSRVSIGIAPSVNRIEKVATIMAEVTKPVARETLSQFSEASLQVRGVGSISTIDSISVEGKRVLQRVDFNVPVSVEFTADNQIDLGKVTITDANRIEAEIPTIKELLKQDPKYITLVTHFEPAIKKPGMEKAKKTGIETRVIAAKLKELLPELANQIVFLEGSVNADGLTVTKSDLDRMHKLNGTKIFVLDQIRFARGETAGDQKVRDQIAGLGDVYINDGFAAFHREHASMTVNGIKEKAVGRLVEYEVAHLSKAFNPKRPMVAIFGGAKVEDKVAMINNFIDSMENTDTILIAGAMAYTFIKAIDPSVQLGKSLYFPDQLQTAKEVLARAKTKGIRVLLPIDHVAAVSLGKEARLGALSTSDKNIPDKFMGVDIGPLTQDLYRNALENAQTVVWNGPAGAFEDAHGGYTSGSRAIATQLKTIAEKGADVVIGGGDTGNFIKKSGVDTSKMFISTAGGASFEFLSAKGDLPVLRQFVMSVGDSLMGRWSYKGIRLEQKQNSSDWKLTLVGATRIGKNGKSGNAASGVEPEFLINGKNAARDISLDVFPVESADANKKFVGDFRIWGIRVNDASRFYRIYGIGDPRLMTQGPVAKKVFVREDILINNDVTELSPTALSNAATGAIVHEILEWNSRTPHAQLKAGGMHTDEVRALIRIRSNQDKEWLVKTQLQALTKEPSHVLKNLRDGKSVAVVLDSLNDFTPDELKSAGVTHIILPMVDDIEDDERIAQIRSAGLDWVKMTGNTSVLEITDQRILEREISSHAALIVVQPALLFATYSLFAAQREEQEHQASVMQDIEKYIAQRAEREEIAALENEPLSIHLVHVPEKDLNTKVKFGTNGWRDLLDDGIFTIDNIGRIAHAAATRLKEMVASGELVVNNPTVGLRVLAAFDARETSEDFAKRLVEVFAAHGIVIHFADEIATSPAAAAMTREELGADAYDIAFQITASHNDSRYNGIKIFQRGVVAPDLLVGQFGEYANDSSRNSAYPRIPFEKLSVKTIPIAKITEERYMATFPALAIDFQSYLAQNPGFSLTIDPMHGSTSPYLSILESMGAKIVRRTPMSAGTYAKKMSDGSWYRPEPLKKFLDQDAYADFAKNANDGSIYVGLDGDGDRVAIWVKQNNEVKELIPNDLGVLYSWYLTTSGRTTDASVICKTLPTTYGMNASAKAAGMKFVVTPVGSKHFAPYLYGSAQEKAVVATEESGHHAVRIGTETYFDDATAQALLLLEIIAATQADPFTNLQTAQQWNGFSAVYNRANEDIDNQVADNILMPFGDKQRVLGHTPLASTPRELAQRIIDRIGKAVEQIYVTKVNPETKVNEVITLEEYESDTVNVTLKPSEGLNVLFTDGSWAQVRVSGTEGMVTRNYTESTSEADRKRMERAVFQAIGFLPDDAENKEIKPFQDLFETQDRFEEQVSTLVRTYQFDLLSELVSAMVMKDHDSPELWQSAQSIVLEIAQAVIGNKDLDSKVVDSILFGLREGSDFQKLYGKNESAPKAALALAYSDILQMSELNVATFRNSFNEATYEKVLVYVEPGLNGFADARDKTIESVYQVLGINKAKIEIVEAHYTADATDYSFLTEETLKYDSVNIFVSYSENEVTPFTQAVQAASHSVISNRIRVISGALDNALRFGEALATVRELFVQEGNIADIKSIEFTDEAKTKLGFILANPAEIARMMTQGAFIADEIRQTIINKVQEALRSEIISTFA
jgi:phosphoglycerate kinase